MTKKELATTDPMTEWRDIVNQLVDNIEDDLPDNVIKATELMLSGMPNHTIARQLGVTTNTIKEWIKKYPTISIVVGQGKKMLTKWRLSRLEQQYLSAIEKSQEILNVDFYVDPNDNMSRKIDSKAMTVVAQQARFIIEQFTKTSAELSLKSDGESITMNASGDALDYIAKELAKHREYEEPIETTFRVVDEKINKPVLDSDGNPMYGEMGILDQNDEGILCHICGKRYKNLVNHTSGVHSMPDDVYELTFMLEEGALKNADSTRT